MHSYNFLDEVIHLDITIDIHFDLTPDLGAGFQTETDSLKFTALNKIYNKGFLQKIEAKILGQKLKDYYTVIQVNTRRNAYDIIVKDRTSS